jgi:hypothetical protein
MAAWEAMLASPLPKAAAPGSAAVAARAALRVRDAHRGFTPLRLRLTFVSPFAFAFAFVLLRGAASGARLKENLVDFRRALSNCLSRLLGETTDEVC